MSTELEGIVEKLTALRDERDRLGTELAAERWRLKISREYREKAERERDNLRKLLDAAEISENHLRYECGNLRGLMETNLATAKGMVAKASAERDDLRAKLAAAEKERDEAKSRPTHYYERWDAAAKLNSTLEAERDAAREELATLRALLPEVRKVCKMAIDYWPYTFADFKQRYGTDEDLTACDITTKAATALLAKLPPEQTQEQPKGCNHDITLCCDECKPQPVEQPAERKWECSKCGRGRITDGVCDVCATEYHWDGKRETTPQPATGNVPLTLVGPASLKGKMVRLPLDSIGCASGHVVVEVRA